MSAGKILVIEDEPMIAQQIMLAIEHAGFLALGPAVSIVEAITRIDAQKPDAATLDYQLLDGTAGPVSDHLTALGIPFILSSGNVSAAAINFQVLPNAVLPKPFRPDELEAVISELMRPLHLRDKRKQKTPGRLNCRGPLS